jgi:DNA modification methylase
MFCGSGSVLVSCKNNSRNGIGIEKNEEFYNLSKKRIE